MVSPVRNFKGYGANPPDPLWPNGARLAINFVINLEEGAERSILSGDPVAENYLLELALRAPCEGQRDYLSESMFEYGSRCGIWRLLRLFERHTIPVTCWACGQALEVNPDIGRYLHQMGHEIAGHGYRWIDYRTIDKQTEAEHITRTMDIIRQLTGEPPAGWYTGRRSENTRALLVEAGILYDSESYADDLPYWIQVNGKRHLVIPYSFDVNDAKYCLTPGWMSGMDFLSYLDNSLNCLYREGETSPKMMTVALHARISGRPGRAEIIEQFLEKLENYPDIWIATRRDIARHWHSEHINSAGA